MANSLPQDSSLLWAQGLPQKELYDAYSETIGTRFPAFGVRPYEEARYDMSQPFHAYDDSDVVSQTMVDVIVTPESHDRFTQDLNDFVEMHGLRSWIDYGGAVLFATDHGMFTDVPITAETLGRIGFGERDKTIMSVSEMITAMELELDPKKGPKPVIDTLSHISSVAVTVPRLDGKPSQELVKYRETKNKSGLVVLENFKNIEGSATVLSIIGRHNHTSKSGGTHYVNEPNRRTLEPYIDERVKVVPTYIHCPTFGKDGSVEPADMKYELFSPVQLTDLRRDTKRIVRQLRDATRRSVGSDFRHGVKIKSWKAQQRKRKAKNIKHRFTHETQQTTADDY